MKNEALNLKNLLPPKKVIIISFILMNYVSNSKAQSTVATLTISALINEIITISITPLGNYSNLNVNTTQVDVPVATIYESSNSSNGYLVKARSVNNGKIQNTSGGDNVPYMLRYGGGGAVQLSNSDQVMREQNIGGTYNSVNKDVTISFLGVPATNLKSGTYNDVITFTIESK